MTFAQFFNKARRRLGDDCALFERFVGDATVAIGEVTGYPNNYLCRKVEVMSAARLYVIWTNLLREFAVQQAEHNHDPVFSEATEIAAVLRKILLREFNMEIDKVIISPMGSY